MLLFSLRASTPLCSVVCLEFSFFFSLPQILNSVSFCGVLAIACKLLLGLEASGAAEVCRHRAAEPCGLRFVLPHVLLLKIVKTFSMLLKCTEFKTNAYKHALK